MSGGAAVLRMRGIRKEFPGAVALDGVDLDVREAEIHALTGENGAGKSTLVKVLSGVHPHGSYTGEVLVGGEPRRFAGTADSERAGIAIIHQELALVPQLTVAENVFLGNERVRGRGPLATVDWGRTTVEARRLLARVGLDADPSAPVAGLGVGHRQLVEIAKAIAKPVRLLILDEPTSALNEEESDNLLRLLLEFKARGIASILISHRLNEVVRVADRVTVLRDGRSVETLDAARGEVDEERIIRGMVGRDLENRYPPRTGEVGGVRFEVRDWTVDHPDRRRAVQGASLTVRRGEVVGLAGLMGAGRTEFAMNLFGRCYGRYVRGTLHKDGRRVRLRDPGEAVAAGVAYVPEDRKELGLLLDAPIRENLTLAALDRVGRRGVLHAAREVVAAEELRTRMRVKCRDVSQPVGELSGGNQQKVVLGRWVFARPDLLVLDEPTRGVDVGAKYEIYQVIRELAAGGAGVLLISSELPELLGMCDRIYAMCEGRVTGCLPASRADQESLMRLMTRTGAAPTGETERRPG
ncbi:putative multiple sugar transport system ATP-binding protein [Nocardiopsis composta]|uniref:Putative multiple sugar transport system ATP-binding protein n=2 Tax=Nocardiopsis composta TaxID=157465 RepID=A0A7W8VC29_9ACTN|nr:putative multiple sugar transport system ATP-binding protein [Nocardiopsis composta]